MIEMDQLVVWLNAVPTDLGTAFVDGPRQPEFGNADDVAVVTALGGLGLTLEGFGDQPSFQIKMVSRDHRRSVLHRSIMQIDTALLFGDFPADLWGTRVQYVDRSAGPPESAQEDELDRVAYVCTYIVHEMPER